MSKRIRKEINYPEMVREDISDLEEDLVLTSLVERPNLLTEFNNVLNTAIVADGAILPPGS